MSTTIYWFSGTGNSLAIARTIADRLEDAELIPIVRAQEQKQERVQVAGTIGIVCPVYWYSLPLVVKEFIERMDASEVDYAFLVLTMGGMPGMAITHARTLLRRAGKPLDAEYALMMPGNYIAEYNARKPAGARKMADRGKRVAERIATTVASRRKRRSIGSLIFLPTFCLIHAAVGRRFERTCRKRDERFVVTDACTSCGTCVRVCPVGNIELDEGRPRWLHRCEQCFACIHLCPTEAIQLRSGRTKRRRRYHHPDVTVADLIVTAEAQEGWVSPLPRSTGPEERVRA